jgi:hypothetical protein
MAPHACVHIGQTEAVRGTRESLTRLSGRVDDVGAYAEQILQLWLVLGAALSGGAALAGLDLPSCIAVGFGCAFVGMLALWVLVRTRRRPSSGS